MSLENIAKTLHDFSLWSGLTMNQSKTDLFTGGLTLDETNDLTSLGFKLGSLPIRYLGLPLMHRKLRIGDYRPLLDKITQRFTSWKSRALSFAGRLQLIKSVIYGLLNFWFTAFILPKGCLSKIQSLCTRFLWSGDIEKKNGAKVGCNELCLPMNEGGLGLRNLKVWNLTLCLRLIWVLFCNHKSLWRCWIKENRIKNRIFWEQEQKGHSSWTWKALLSLRNAASAFLMSRVGNGNQTSFWHDVWTPFGPLIRHFGPKGPRELGIPTDARICSVVNENGWKLPSARSDKAEALQIHLASVSLPCASAHDDEFLCRVDNVELDAFSTKLTWVSLRPRAPIQLWTSNVWYKGAIPRHAFHLWVTHLNRLPTRSRLKAWGLQIQTSCCLCDRFEENRDHIFLRCEVSQHLWAMIIRRLGYRTLSFHSWNAFSDWLGSKDSICPTTLRRLVAQAVIYSLWHERNNRLHNNISSSSEVIFKLLNRRIRDAILARRNRKKFKNLLAKWLTFA